MSAHAADAPRPSLLSPQGSHVSDNDPAIVQAELRRSLEGQHVPSRIPSAPHWSERLASDSEAVVKAEREATGAACHGAAPAAPGEDVAADVAALREQTVTILAEEAFVETVDNARMPARNHGHHTKEGGVE